MTNANPQYALNIFFKSDTVFAPNASGTTSAVGYSWEGLNASATSPDGDQIYGQRPQNKAPVLKSGSELVVRLCDTASQENLQLWSWQVRSSTGPLISTQSQNNPFQNKENPWNPTAQPISPGAVGSIGISYGFKTRSPAQLITVGQGLLLDFELSVTFEVSVGGGRNDPRRTFTVDPEMSVGANPG